jgi:hypothetical protein
MVEVRKKVENPDSTRLDRWYNGGFTGEFSSRIYGMFARMASVRTYDGEDYKVKFKPRGFPEDMTWWSQRQFYLYVVDDENAVDWGDGYCLVESAERWVEKGYSKWLDEGHTTITNPDYHSCSWLTASELRECFDDCFKNEDGTYHGDYVEWLGLVSLCEGIESDGKHECRVVFCFDN